MAERWLHILAYDLFSLLGEVSGRESASNNEKGFAVLLQ
jgi:hypothetical protein